MNCGLCKAEAVLVSHGRDIGEYYYCRACKLEQKEWEARIKPKLEVKPPSTQSFAQLLRGYYATSLNNFSNHPNKPKAAAQMAATMYCPCNLCGAEAGQSCARDCVNSDKLYE